MRRCRSTRGARVCGVRMCTRVGTQPRMGTAVAVSRREGATYVMLTPAAAGSALLRAMCGCTGEQEREGESGCGIEACRVCAAGAGTRAVR